MKHSIVYAEQGMYAGWPANHGAWQWGNEFLVGFLRGKYRRGGGPHNISEPYQKMLARSLDGGETWTVETPNVDFECEIPSCPPTLNLSKTIIRVCGIYDTGGERCVEQGGFYTSEDRGKSWNGPYFFNGLTDLFTNDIINTSRTAILNGKENLPLFFLSEGNAKIWGVDCTFCAEYRDGRFCYRSMVCEDQARAVMPSVTRMKNGRVLVALRRKQTGRRDGWIDVFCSDNSCHGWRHLSFVGSTGSHNGNPPALRTLPNGEVLCIYGNRDEGCIVYSISRDDGATWNSGTLRPSTTNNVDVGYPQLFVRDDGIPVCVYYWVSDENKQQHIAVTKMDWLL